MKLSNNFILEEFTRSNNGKRMGIKNEPDEKQIKNLQKLCVYLLQPLREIYDTPFYINSGFRCIELNRLIGGVAASQHTKGQAADVRVTNPHRLLSELLRLGIDFDQAILYASFLHLSYNEENNRRQVLYAKGVFAK